MHEPLREAGRAFDRMRQELRLEAGAHAHADRIVVQRRRKTAAARLDERSQNPAVEQRCHLVIVKRVHRENLPELRLAELWIPVAQRFRRHLESHAQRRREQTFDRETVAVAIA